MSALRSRNARVIAALVAFALLPVAAATANALGAPAFASFIDDRVIELGVIAGLIRLLFSGKGGRAENEAPAKNVSWREVVILFLAAVMLAIAGFGTYMRAHDVAGYRHDWAWPLDDRELRDAFGFLTADWRQEALGTPKPYPTLYPIAAVAGVLGMALHSATVLAVLLASSAIAATCGAYLLARRVGATSELAAAIGALLYTCGTFVVDKTVAGHFHIVVAYAVLPWLGVVQLHADRAPRSRLPFWMALGAALFGIALSALTFVAFATIAMFALAFTLANRKRALIVAASALAGGMLCDGQSFLHLATIQTLDNGRSGFTWLLSLSSPSAALLGGYSYLTGYSKDAVPAWIEHVATFGFGPASLAVFGYAIVLGARRAAAFATVGLIGVAGATGVLGPFGLLKVPAFEHVHPLAAFREFYNFECLTWLGLCVTSAMLLGGFRPWAHAQAATSRMAGGLVWAGACALAASVVWPFFAGAAGHVPFVHLTPELGRLGDRLVPQGGERVALFPLVQPLQPGTDRFGGTDPFALGFREHPTLAEWQPGPPVALAMFEAVTSRDDDLARLFDAYGVRWLALRHHITSAAAKFWYANSFASQWDDDGFYAGIASSRHFEHVDEGPGATVLENPHAAPNLSLGAPAVWCAGDGLLALAAGRCARRLAAPPDTRDVREIALPPEPHDADPNLGWTAIKAIYGRAPSLATATSGVGSIGTGTAYSTGFDLARSGELYVQCAADAALHLYLDAKLLAIDCHGSFDAPMRWFHAGPVAAGAHRLVAASPGGLAAIQRLVETPAPLRDPEAVLSAFRWSAPIPANLPGRAVFRRTEATEAEGTLSARTSAEVIFNDTYDTRWQLTLTATGGTQRAQTLEPERVNGFANGYRVAAGDYRFILRYRPAAFDLLLERTQSVAWLVFAGTLLGTPLAEALSKKRNRRGNAPKGAE